MSSLRTQLRACVRGRAVPVATLALLLAAPAASAQSQADVDLKAITAYSLTMPKYKQYLEPRSTWPMRWPRIPSWPSGSTATPTARWRSRSSCSRDCRRSGQRSRRPGLTTRDYLLTQGALLQAGMAYAMTKDTKMPPDTVIKKAGVSRANLEFYQKNEAEIGRSPRRLRPGAEAGGRRGR